MNKKEKHLQDIHPLLDGFLASGDDRQVTDYLLSHSNLPGPRGNLELADAFGDAVAARAGTGGPALWAWMVPLAAIPPEQAPVNDAREFLPFCGAVGIGTLGAARPELFEAALDRLRVCANDPRWRMREAVCFGLGRLLACRAAEVLGTLQAWAATGTPLEMRAAAAGLAEPDLLRDEDMARAALDVHRIILERVRSVEERRSADFKTLRQALGYTLSVVVQALPGEGFPFMAQLLASQDPDMVWIVKQNLKKNRLVKHFPEEVQAMLEL